MRVLISAVGTRGDVQPAIALALEVRKLGHLVRMCVPPNFVDWVANLGFDALPLGIEMRAPRAGLSTPPAVVPDLVTDQFEVVGSAAIGCDVAVAAGTHQYAARSIAELRVIPYVLAVYAPVSLPSTDLAPPGQVAELDGPAENLRMWDVTRRSWNERSLERVNANRDRLGLRPVGDVLGHILSDHPILATDPILGPAPPTLASQILQTGAWMLEDRAELPGDLRAFLDDGEPPVYLGLGSMPAAAGTGRTLIEAVRALGRRVVLSRGWAGLESTDKGSDLIEIGDANHQALFPRVAAVVHHGGAGTTTTAARAGIPQVALPMFSDQFYWGRRLDTLGLGASVPLAELSEISLISALREVLKPGVAARAAAAAESVALSGAMIAARHVVARSA